MPAKGDHCRGWQRMVGGHSRGWGGEFFGQEMDQEEDQALEQGGTRQHRAILTPTLDPITLTRVTWICICKFPGTDSSNPLPVAGAQHRVKGEIPYPLV